NLAARAVEHDRKFISKRFLRVIPKYGTVVLRRDKPAFTVALKSLEDSVAKFAESVRANLDTTITKHREALTNSPFPALKRRPPREWTPSNGLRPDPTTIRAYLEQDLADAFGTANDLIGEMRVECRFKGVTHELLTDPEFVKAAVAEFPELQKLHDE